MDIVILQIGAHQLERYARVPISFWVDSILRVEPINQGLGGLALVEEAVDPPQLKNYDRQQAADARPESWPSYFDTHSWGFFLGVQGENAVGAAAVAIDTPGLNMLEGRQDLAVLWDIRVHPDYRGLGVGHALFWHAAEWSRLQGCRQMKVETQNVNVRACRFYARQGCTLGTIDRFGYARDREVAHEVMLLWYLEL